MLVAVERRHVLSGPQSGERSTAFALVELFATTPGDASGLLERARTVLDSVLNVEGSPWPDMARWVEILPGWFIEACAPEEANDGTERPPDKQREASLTDRWTLSGWLYWLAPAERQWYWWDGKVVANDMVQVTVEVNDWPAPVGAMEWLLRACGATGVVAEDV